MPWPWVNQLIDYWADHPPAHEMLRVYVETATTWKPRGAEGLKDPAARAANNRFAATVTPGRGDPKSFDELPELMQSILHSMRNQSKAVN